MPDASHTEKVIALLASIDRRLSEQNKLLRRFVGPDVATDEELDGQHGDPVVKYDPDRIWKGEPHAGKHFSECPPEYLDALAKACDSRAWVKRRDGEEKAASFSEADAARARGWAARLRKGWVRPPPPLPTGNPFAKKPPPADPNDDDF